MDKAYLTLRALAQLEPAVEACFKAVQDEFNRSGDISPDLEEQVEATVHKLAGLIAEQVSTALMQVNPSSLRVTKRPDVKQEAADLLDRIHNRLDTLGFGTDDEINGGDVVETIAELWPEISTAWASRQSKG